MANPQKLLLPLAKEAIESKNTDDGPGVFMRVGDQGVFVKVMYGGSTRFLERDKFKRVPELRSRWERIRAFFHYVWTGEEVYR